MRGWIAAVLLCIALPATAQTGCPIGACVAPGPRLVQIDSTQGPLLNLLFTALLPGTTVNATVLDWNGLAQSNINLNALITRLGTNLNLSSPAQVLDANITLAQLRLAMAQVLAADGNTLAANILNSLPLAAPGLTGSFRLLDLLQIQLPNGALSNINVNVLDLLTGSVQLYNFRNVLTTPQPITINTAAIGLPGVANVQLWLQVVEPPIYLCAPQGVTFHSATIRLKLNLDVLGGLDLQPLIAAVNALGLGLTNITLTQQVLKLQLYADIARAEGTVSSVDLIGNAVTFSARPGLVNLYIGTIADAVFFNRSSIITPAIVTPVTLTTLDLGFNASVAGIGLVNAHVPLTVTARAVAQGSPPLQTFTVNGPFPQTRTFSSGSVSAGTLIVQLLNDLNVQITSGTPTVTLLGIPIPVPALLVPVINQVVVALQATIGAVAVNVLQPVLNTLLGGLVDNLLRLVGLGLGNAVFTVEGISQQCPIADLSLTKTNTPGSGPADLPSDTVTPGTSFDYEIVVRNAGPDPGDGAVVKDPAATGLSCTAATCVGATNGASCPTGTPVAMLGALQSAAGLAIAQLPANSAVTLRVTCAAQ